MGVRGRNKNNLLPPDKVFGGVYADTFEKWVMSLDRSKHALEGKSPEHCTTYELELLYDLDLFETAQMDYIDPKNPPVHILRLENINEDFKIIQNHYNVHEPLVRRNESFYDRHSPKGKKNLAGRPRVRDYYSDKLQEFVYNALRRDFEYFGYSKELPNV